MRQQEDNERKKNEAKQALKEIILGSRLTKPISRQRVGRIERGEVSMTVAELWALAAVFKVHPYAIICERDVSAEDVVLLNRFLSLLDKKDTAVLPRLRTMIEKATAGMEKERRAAGVAV